MSDKNEPQQDENENGVTFEVVEGVVEGGKRVRRRGVYLLPNLFTTTALFCGFFAIVAAMNGMFEKAAIACFVAMILDGLDGRVARATHTQSAFGAEYDSLSDLVAFGVAPALVVYAWSLHDLGKVGWMISFVYMACAALRLARFNVQIETADKRFFTGVPSPTAAAVIASMVWSGVDMEVDGAKYSILCAIITAYIAIAMVANVKFHSFKEIDLKGRVPFFVIPLVILIIAVVFIDPPKVLFTVAFVYSLSGLVLFGWQKLKN